MRGKTTQPARPPVPLLPASVLSILMHSAVIGLLYAAVQHSPRGTVYAERGSMGLVLTATRAEGTADERSPSAITQAVAVDDVPMPPTLLVAKTNDAPQSSERESTDETPTEPSNPTTPKTQGSAQHSTKRHKSGGNAGSRPALAGARLGTLGSSGYARTSVFGVQGKGNKFIYVFDRSASMEGLPLAAAKNQLLKSLQSLDSVHQFHILFFNTGIQAFDISGGGHRIAFATDRNKRLAANFVGGITADGGTDRMLALREAINFAPDVIFFLTDADDPMSPGELAEIARANRKVQAAICVIEFGKKPTPQPNDFLARLARESGGQYGYVDTTKLPAEQTVLSTKPDTK